MTWRDTARLCGVTLAVTSIATLARPASAQDIERILAGIRLNSKSSAVLAKFGNPNEVIIGDLGVRGGAPGQTGAGQGQGQGQFGGGLNSGAGGPPSNYGPPGGFGAPGGVGAPGGGPPSYGPSSYGGSPAGMGGPRAGGPQGPGGYGYRGGAPVGGQGFPGSQGGMPPPDGSEFGGGGFPGQGETAGPGVGAFGQSQSTLARQQEVTWVYNRKVNNNLVTYEFLIGPNGQVIQIRATGYRGGTARTKRGIALGSTYKTVVRAYGYPEEHLQVGRTLVASYKKTAHVQFQFLNARGAANPMDDGNKVISITIATIE